MTIPARPSVTDEMILEAAAEVMSDLNPTDDDAKEIMIGQIAQQYHCFSHPLDGFELARRLQDYHSWDINSDDVFILDGVESGISRRLRDAEKAWFEEHDIQPPHPIGTAIQEGVIKGINEYSAATYNIQETGCLDPNRSLLVKFEDAVPVDPADLVA